MQRDQRTKAACDFFHCLGRGITGVGFHDGRIIAPWHGRRIPDVRFESRPGRSSTIVRSEGGRQWTLDEMEKFFREQLSSLLHHLYFDFGQVEVNVEGSSIKDVRIVITIRPEETDTFGHLFNPTPLLHA